MIVMADEQQRLMDKRDKVRERALGTKGVVILLIVEGANVSTIGYFNQAWTALRAWADAEQQYADVRRNSP